LLIFSTAFGSCLGGGDWLCLSERESTLYAPDCCLWSLPGNNEVIGLWIVAPFSGDFLISLNNLPIAVLMACAAIELGGRIGLTPIVAHFTALAVVCQFVVLNQLLDASNDLGVAGLFRLDRA